MLDTRTAWRWALLGLAIFILFFLFIWALCQPASAQHDHAAGHAYYSKWTNQNGQLCCNNADCGSLKPEEEKQENGKLMVKIEGQWCEVKPHMYLKTGNAPDWSSSHVCVWPDYEGRGSSACSRLMCYQPKPLF